MTIDALKHLHGHPQITGRGPDVRPALHEPRRCRVSKRVRRHNTFKAGVLHNLREYLIDPSDRAAFPFHNVTRPRAFPAPQMRQKLRRQWRRRSALIRFLLTFRTAIKDAAFKIDVASARFALKRRLSYRLRAAPGVERDQDKARNVTTRMLQDRTVAAEFRITLIAPRRSKQLRSFLNRKPSLAGRALVRRYDADDSVVQPFPAMMIDRGSQMFQVSASYRVRVL